MALPVTGQPTTAAGRVLLSCIDLDYENYDPDPHSMIRAIETEARSQLLDELIAKVEGLPGEACRWTDDPNGIVICDTHAEIVYGDEGCEDQPRMKLRVLAILTAAKDEP